MSKTSKKSKRVAKPTGEAVLAATHGSPAQDNRLLNAVTGLMEIVEGVRNLRWQHEGRRLVDTPQWCDLYCAWCAEKRKLENRVICDGVGKDKPANP